MRNQIAIIFQHIPCTIKGAFALGAVVHQPLLCQRYCGIINAGSNQGINPLALMDKLSLNSASFCTTEYPRVLRTKAPLSAAKFVFFTVKSPYKEKRFGLKYSQIFKFCTNFQFSLCCAKSVARKTIVAQMLPKQPRATYKTK